MSGRFEPSPPRCIRPIPPEAFRRRPWKNGGGVSVTIAEERLPGAEADGWDGTAWQLGFTTIEKPGPFSDLSGFERLQTVVQGSGLVLDTPSGQIDLRTPLAVARYDGGLPIVSRLEAGPVRVVNLIARRALAEIDLAVLGPGDTAPGAGIQLLFAFDQPASLDVDGFETRLEGGHAARLEGAARVTCPEGRVVLATIVQPPI